LLPWDSAARPPQHKTYRCSLPQHWPASATRHCGHAGLCVRPSTLWARPRRAWRAAQELQDLVGKQQLVQQTARADAEQQQQQQGGGAEDEAQAAGAAHFMASLAPAEEYEWGDESYEVGVLGVPSAADMLASCWNPSGLLAPSCDVCV